MAFNYIRYLRSILKADRIKFWFISAIDYHMAYEVNGQLYSFLKKDHDKTTGIQYYLI
jgi:hypothetical protein